MHRMEIDRIVAQAKRDHEKRLLEIEEDRRAFEEQMKVRQELDDAILRMELAAMTPEERAEWRAGIQSIADAISRQEVGLHNIGEFIQSGAWRTKK